ncbi:MAG: leucine-rich repeat protein [Ruminococcus sp.]|nr:leucine-rich repeat protein [Ruminococcus sp.]
MKKRIIAGVAALLMVASIAPANSYNVFTPALISASAAKPTEIEMNDTTVRIAVDGDNVKITVDDLQTFLGVPYNTTDLHINMEPLRNACEEVAGNLDGKNIILAAPTKTFSGYAPYAAHISFEDDLITEVGDNFASGLKNVLQDVNFGSHITRIGANAFAGDNILQGTGSTTLDLSGIKYIGGGAFQNCEKIQHLTMDSVETIDVNAFSGAKGLLDVTFPDTLTSIGNNAFKYCENIIDIDFGSNNQLTSIGSSAFIRCKKLKNIKFADDYMNSIPDSVTDLGTSVFEDCEALQNFRLPDGIEELPNRSFFGCSKLNDFAFGTSVENSRCAVIGNNAFQNCAALDEIILPDANTTIGVGAFKGCTMLEKVETSDILEYLGKEYYIDDDVIWPAIQENEGGPFQNCEKLSMYPRSRKSEYKKNKLIFPDTLTVIQDKTFKGCIGITDVESENISHMGMEAFMNCVSLTKITANVPILEKGVFSNCLRLTDVTISPELNDIHEGAFDGCTALTTIVPKGVDASKYEDTFYMPKTLAAIRLRAFRNCSAFKYLTFEDGSQFAILGESSFEGCTHLLGSNVNGQAKDTINMPEGVLEIQKKAFSKCNALQKVYFLGEVKTIGDNAFEECTSLKEVKMKDTITQIRPSAFLKCSSLEHMPLSIDGKGFAFSNVKNIYSSTFKDCKALQEVYIPEYVENIESEAFSGCSELKRIQWAKDSSLTELGDKAFENCTSLALISSAEKASVSTFPDTLEKIGDNCFAKSAITNLKIGKPANGSKIFLGKNMLQGNEALTTLDMSETYTDKIPEGFCQSCTNLKTVYVPDANMAEVGARAFSKCSYLHTFGKKSDKAGEFTFPDYMTAIKEKAFEENYCMEVVNFPATTDQIWLSMFNIHLKGLKQEVVDTYTPLKRINVDKNNQNYCSVDGILYSKDMKRIMVRPLYMEGDSFTLPSSVEVVGGYALAANQFLKNVYLQEDLSKPSALKTIEEYAFNDDHNLEFVDFGSNDTVELEKNLCNRKEKTTFYGVSGSTAEKYAENNKSNVTFVDNDKVAKTIVLKKSKNDGETEITGKFAIAKKKNSYTFLCDQFDGSGAQSVDTIVWESSNPEVATIDNNGKLTIKSMGTTKITAKNAAGTASKTIDVEINETGEAKSDNSNGGTTSRRPSNSSSKPDNTSSKSGNDDSQPDGKVENLGDVNNDGNINVADIALVASHIKGIKALGDDAQKRADVNRDTNINVADIATLASHIKGIKPIKN